MTKSLAVLILAVSLISVGASQLVLKARMAALTLPVAGGVTGNPWVALLLRALADPYVWLGAAMVGVGAVCWYVALTKLPLSLMMPVASIIAPCVSIGAWYFLGESLSLAKLGAILTIMVGVAWLGWLNA